MEKNLVSEHQEHYEKEVPHEFTKSSKTVSFHQSTNNKGIKSLYSKNYSNLSENAWYSRDSNTGYIGDGQVEFDEGIRHGYYQRLYRFYERYNPQKLKRVEEYLTAYKGNEEQLFAILTGKYGPEPPDTNCISTHSNYSSENASVMHYVGKRYNFPSSVSPQQGNTDCETPYWGSSNLISDRDILALLCNLETSNEELQKCYMGLFAQHPTNSWNGMTYITRADGIAPGNTTFLGHIWAANLASKKAMVYEGNVYHRIILYCTEECQHLGQHERWRLSVYSGDVNSLQLLRVIWDPIISLEPIHDNNNSFLPNSSSEGTLSMGPSASCCRFKSENVLEPQQPSIAAMMTNIMTSLERLEEKVCGRLDILDNRISSLEAKIGDSK